MVELLSLRDSNFGTWSHTWISKTQTKFSSARFISEKIVGGCLGPPDSPSLDVLKYTLYAWAPSWPY